MEPGKFGLSQKPTLGGMGGAAVSNNPPPAIAAAGAAGNDADASRSNHTHAHGTHTDETNHALVTSNFAGFMSSADKIAHDALVALNLAGFKTTIEGLLKNNAGNPEGVVTAIPGAICLDTNATGGIGVYSKLSGAGNTGWVAMVPVRSGAGSPEGVVTAPIGALFTRTDGGANTTLYVKESGAGNTGWVAK